MCSSDLDSAKTKSSLRTLPLVGSFRDYFQKVKEAQELNKKVCGNCYNYDYDGYVFVNELGAVSYTHLDVYTRQAIGVAHGGRGAAGGAVVRGHLLQLVIIGVVGV